MKSWIFFENGQHWWQRWFLKPGYGHIYILQEIEGGYIIIAPLYGALTIKSVKATKEELPLMLSKNANCVYHIEKGEPIEKCSFHLRLINPLSCVGIVKYYLGIRRWWIITPWQLAQYLLKVTRDEKKEKLIIKSRRIK